MFLDDLLKLADAQTTTYSTASGSTLNTVAVGESYEGAWFYCRVDTTFVTGAGVCFAEFQLQTDTLSTMNAGTTLLNSATFPVATLVRGFEYKARIPPGVKQFLRGYMKVTSHEHVALGAGSDTDFFSTAVYDMFIVKDVEVANTGVLA